MELNAVRDSTGRTSLVISGEVDMSGSDELRAAGSAALRDGGHLRLEIDLSTVTFIDSTGLGALIHLRNLANEHRGTLLLVEPSAPVLRLLALTRLDEVFTISAKSSPR